MFRFGVASWLILITLTYNLHRLLPTAVAIGLISSINLPNCSGVSDCAPSLNASDGFG